MAQYVRPKSNLCFMKQTHAKQSKKTEKTVKPENVEIRLMKSQIEELKNVVKEIENRLEKSEEENLVKGREFQAREDEYFTVLNEMMKTKKENDFLMAQLKMQQCANECATLPLLDNENYPADISIQSLNINDQVFDLSDQREPHERVPVSEEAFEGWDKLLKNRQTNASMKSLYLAINLKDMKPFLKECIVKTFAKPLIQKIHFEPGNSFNESNILSCLIETVQQKFKEKNLDNKEARKEIADAFRRFRDAEYKKQQK